MGIRVRFSTGWTVALSSVALVGYVCAFVLKNFTMVDFSRAMFVCFLVAAAAGLFVWRLFAAVSGSIRFSVNYLIACVFLTGLFSGMFFMLNFCFSSVSTDHDEKVAVVRKYKETRYRMKRIARNRYVRGERYYEYYIDCRYGDGSVKPMLVSVSRFNRLRSGDSIGVGIEEGLFGFPVVKRRDF